MLKLVDIAKDYYVNKGTSVRALKGISIEFRRSEFVAVLGPSGCGKTTLLNIIGGLDHPSGGDLLIEGVSTKDYKDADWDNYRNHRIGFVFQSYNLIPHQNVLQNVELALNIGGIRKAERENRAKAALDEVGLSGEYYKKPNELSGGQCQRVAIARALVTDPEILLADEPTGALDTETSVQIMDLLKEVSRDRLVIMVTHNPDLAARYATRIVKLLDGLVVSDSLPYDGRSEAASGEKGGKAKLSLVSAFRLSFRNLLSKGKRTALVAVAASIGIIGVSSVLAVSNGVTGYIGDMEEDMLSGSPVSIEESGLDMSALLNLASSAAQSQAIIQNTKDGYINIDKVVETLADENGNVNNFMFQNDITQEYVDYVLAMSEDLYSSILLDYGIDPSPNLFTASKLQGEAYSEEGELVSMSLIKSVYQSVLGKTSYSQFSSLLTTLSTPFQQLPSSVEMVESQYDILNEGGYIPTKAGEIALVANGSTLSDIYLAQLGFMGQEEFLNGVDKATGSEGYDPALDQTEISFDELLSQTYYYYPNDSLYSKISIPSIGDFWTYDPLKNLSEEEGRIPLKITAILSLKDGLNYGCLSTGLYYTAALTDLMIAQGTSSEIVDYLNENDLPGFTAQNPIAYTYSYYYDGQEYTDGIGALSSVSMMDMTQAAIGEDPVIFGISNLAGSELPSSIEVYASSLETNDEVKAYLTAWNEEGDITVNGVVIPYEERHEIRYTDNLGLVLTMVNSMVGIVTVALVVFTGLSLVVSTVMIAVITYVSVIERVKEIGVIRSLGGRKKDVRRLFNAETVMEGLFAGAIGIAVTYLIELVINVSVGSATGIYTIAALPWYLALAMIALSVFLTWLSGLIPASLAAEKDPVVALRSE